MARMVKTNAEMLANYTFAERDWRVGQGLRVQGR